MSRRWARAAHIAALTVAITVVALGCRNDPSDSTPETSPGDTATATSTSGAASGSTTTGTSSDADMPIGDVVWSACENDLECTSVEVPIDYSDLNRGRLSVALVRRRATNSDQTKGSIFVNPGGPGASGVDFVRDGFKLDPDTAAQYDLIGFDPRGIGLSRPLQCNEDRASEPLPDLSPDDPAEQQVLDDNAAETLQQCQASDADVLDHLTTVNVARDLERLRRAVGDDRLNYYGLSYGTLLAFRYIQLFPTTAGRMVLDGVVDPDRGLAELLTQQALAFEEGFRELGPQCDIDGPCPAGGLLAAFDRLFSVLEESGPVDGVGSSELVMASLLPVYNPAIWPQYRRALVEAEIGQTANLDRLSDFFTGSISFTAYAAFACADASHPEGSDAWIDFAAQLDERAPRFGAVIANELRICSLWPASSYADTNDELVLDQKLTNDVGVLIIGTDGDAATPYENAVNVADQLPSSHLVSVSGQRHTAYNGSRCVRSVVAEFFSDRLELPGRSTCTID